MRGVIVAGGRGRRLGLGVSKALAPLGRRTLLDRAIATAREACDDIVVTMSRDERIDAPGATIVLDPPGSHGPLGGLIAGLEAGAYTRAIGFGGDYPLVPGALLRALLARLERDDGARAIVPRVGGMPQPLVAAYAPDATQRLRASMDSGERSLVAAVMALEPVWLDDAELANLPGGLDAWLNVNTPEDLERARTRLAARGDGGVVAESGT